MKREHKKKRKKKDHIEHSPVRDEAARSTTGCTPVQIPPPGTPNPLPKERDLGDSSESGRGRRLSRVMQSVLAGLSMLTIIWVDLPDDIREALLQRLAG